MSAYICSGKLTTYLVSAANEPIPNQPDEWNPLNLEWFKPPLDFFSCFDPEKLWPEAPQSLLRELRLEEMVAGVLREENYRSVKYRYDKKYADELNENAGPAYLAEINPGDLPKFSADNVFTAIDCYEYQTCEHAGWRISKAQEFCAALRKRWCRGLCKDSTASWGDWD